MLIPRAVPETCTRHAFWFFHWHFIRHLVVISGTRLAWILFVASPIMVPVPSLAQTSQLDPKSAATAEQASVDEEMILALRSNGVERGEFTVLRTAAGDFWITAEDFPKLNMKPLQQARRHAHGQEYFSLAALGATSILFDPALLTLNVDFPALELNATHIDLSNSPPPLEVGRPQNSAIFNYRAGASQSGNDAVQFRLDSDLNVRVGELLLRQEARYDSGTGSRQLNRGTSQAIWDDRVAGTRLIAGDVFTSGGSFGSTFPGAGVLLSKVYAITPDVIRQPTANFQVSAGAPADVEVAVDGSTVYRTHVGPGPITLDNLFATTGARTVRITVTDATGRRQVIDQPYFFTDSVLAKGLHEYSYFAGRRSELGVDNRWHYKEGAWQAFHRYGATDSLTVQAGGEGSRDFATGGLGASFRQDVLGVVSLDLLASADHVESRQAKGWSARYGYTGTNATLLLGHRKYSDGFRTFATSLQNPSLLGEDRISASTRISSAATLSVDLVRSRDVMGDRTSSALRFGLNLNSRTSISAEYQSNRTSMGRDWAANIYLRFDLDRQQWVSAASRSAPGSRGLDLEAARQLPQGEGVGYRVAVTSDYGSAGQNSAFSNASVNWNLRPVTLDFNASSQLSGGSSHYVDATVSGAIVGMGEYIGMTRQVQDGFALARLGVPLAGMNVYLNSQLQGQTDNSGNLLIPQVGAYGRQDVSLDDKQVPMEYELATKRVTIAPAYKSGTFVDFRARKLRALTGSAWLLRASARKPVASRSWTMAGEGGRLDVQTESSGEFYLEDAPPGHYSGSITIDGQEYSCAMTVPTFADAVYELKEGIVCE